MSKTITAGRTRIVTLPTPKDPDDVLLYRMDWSAFLSPLSDTISTSAWDGGGLTVGTDAIETNSLKTTLWLSGGTDGTTYTVANKIVTAEGRTVERSFKLMVEER